MLFFMLMSFHVVGCWIVHCVNAVFILKCCQNFVVFPYYYFALSPSSLLVLLVIAFCRFIILIVAFCFVLSRQVYYVSSISF